MCRIPLSALKLSPPISPPHDGMTSNRRSPVAMGGATGNSVAAAVRDPSQLNVVAACKSQSR